MNRISALLVAITCALLFTPTHATARQKKPNVIIVFIDDMGYGDIGPFGSTKHRTPELDRMAAEGMMLTSFYVSTPFCSPSRAALLTGCYHKRVGVTKVYRPGEPDGLHPDEVTLAEVLKPRGYATGCIGKWHLGDQVKFLPTAQGFDYYFGLPYSNDMWPGLAKGRMGRGKCMKRDFPPLPLLRNNKVLHAVTDQTEITTAYTAEAVQFIKANKDKPFFLYVPHTAVHRPLYPGKAFQGKSQNGFYGDWVEEIDWSMGRIFETIREVGLAENTLVIFTSDNGHSPATAGSAGPLRGHKSQTFEGGMREPTIAWWPGHIPADTRCDEITTAMDLLPTIAKLAGADVPKDRIIDGRDIWPLLSGQPDAKTPHEHFFYYRGPFLDAVRSGPWKLHMNPPGKTKGPLLFNLDDDINESKNVADEHPDVVKRLMGYADQARKDLGDGDQPGMNTRPVGHVDNPKPIIDRQGVIRSDAR